MRTLTKLRLTPYALLVAVGLWRIPLPQPWWDIFVLAGLFAVGLWGMTVRCPVCGYKAALRKSPLLGEYYWIGESCAHCGADFRKV